MSIVIPTSAVSVQKDFWDWMLYATSLLAALIAIFLFLPWALDRRRRPEVRISFRIAESGRPEDLRDWSHAETPDIAAGQAILIEAAIQNVGDAPGVSTLTNFVVPELFLLRCVDSASVKSTVTLNYTAGLPPDYRIRYCAPGAPTWTPGNWFAVRYELTPQPAALEKVRTKARVLFTVGDPGFNRSGGRWLPTLAAPTEPLTAHAGVAWPPRPSSWRSHLRRVRAEPFRRVLCVRGGREDVRDLVVVHKEEVIVTS